jgi:ABC-type transport system substrate-binding protein
MNLRRFLAALAALGCVCVLAGSTATAAGEEIVVETSPFTPAAPQQWIDYSVATTQASWLLNSVTCLKLLDYDEQTGALVPEAAEAMTVSPDGKTYTFTVRPGQAFSGGPADPVDADSFKRAIERATSPAMAASISATPPARNIVAGIEGSAAFYAGTGPFSGIQASGNVLTIQLSAPDSTFIYRISMPYFCATRADAPAGYTGAAPHSGGPYFVSSASASGVPGSLQHEIVLLRNTAYTGSRLRNLGTLRFVQQDSPLAEDYVANAPATYSPPAGMQIVSNITAGIQLMALNTSKAPFSAEPVRQAAAHAVDRTALSAVPGAGWQPTDQFVSPLLPGHEDSNVYSLTGDPGAASALLGGATPSVTLCHPSGPRADVAALAETHLEAVGFQVTRVLPPGELGGYFAYIRNPANCDLAMLGVSPDFPDGSRVLTSLFKGGSPTNFSFYDDPAVNARFDAASTLTPESARRAEYADIDHDLAAAALAIAIGHDRRRDAFADRIGCRLFSQVLFGYAVNRLCIEVGETASPGGTVSTGDEASPAAPLQTSVTVPSGGAVTITQGQSSTTVPPEYQLLEQQLDISAPTQTPPNFLTFTFELDASLLAAAGLTIGEVAVMRNGAGVANCTGEGATPDPCIASRTPQDDGDGEIVVRTTSASIWEFGERYDVSGGFVDPVDDAPTVNTVGAGRTVPARFSLGGNEGLDILAAESPTSAQVACPGAAATDAVEETTSSTGGGLSFDAATGVYQVNWKTSKAWAGTCRRLTIELREGSRLQALFKFK